MFVLSEFEDKTYYICAKSKVTYVQGSTCIVKYRNGGRYGARIIAENANRRVLEKIKAEKYIGLAKEVANQASDDGNASPQEMSPSQPVENCYPNDTAAHWRVLEKIEDEKDLAEGVTNQASEDENASPQKKSPSQPVEDYHPNDTEKNTNQASEDGNDSPQNKSLPHLVEECHPNDTGGTYIIGSKGTHSFSNLIENNTMLMGLLEDIVPTAMADDVSLRVTEFLLESTKTKEMFATVDSFNSATELNDFEKALAVSLISSTRIEETVTVENRTFDVNNQCKKDSTSDISRQLLFEADSTHDNEVSSDFRPSDIDSAVNLGDSIIEEKIAHENTTPPAEKSRYKNDSPRINVPGSSTRDEAEMFVQTATGRKAQDRKSYCMFCKTLQSKFVRHLENKHQDVESVKKFAMLPKSNKERLEMIDAIRKRCMFDFNTNNLVNDGELLVCRRPSAHAPRPASHFVVCENCKGFFSKTTIRHHAQRCFSHNGTRQRRLFVKGREILGRIHAEACAILRTDVFPVMREDDVVRAIRYDRLAILLGNKLCSRHGGLQHQHAIIRSDLRLVGRFLISIKAINAEITDFASVFHPKFYNDAILAIRDVGGYDVTTKKYGAPSTAYAMGSLLKKTAECFKFDCIMREDALQKKRTEDFLTLLEVDLSTAINKGVIESQTEQQRRKKVELPPVSDIKKLNNFLTKQRESASSTLENKFTFDAWTKLAESTLTAIQLFNRCRSGEIERVSIEDFQNHECIRDDELKNMSLEGQKIAKNYVRFTIRGKLNRTVPVLLSADLTRCVQTILKHRQQAGVPRENPYIFGLPSSDKIRHKYLRACVLMRKFAKESKVSFPYKLTGTTLRKHEATACINLNLSQNEVADVADFMGHAEKIHRVHYRQPIVSREIMKMSKILEMAQQNPNQENETESDSDDEPNNLDFITAMEALDNKRDHSQTRDASKNVRQNKIVEMARQNPNQEKETDSDSDGEPGNLDFVTGLPKKALKVFDNKRDHSQTRDASKNAQPSTSKKRAPKRVNNDVDTEESDTTPVRPNQKIKKRSTSSCGRGGPKKRWSIEEKRIAFALFEKCIASGTYPSLKCIQNECKRHPTLQARNPCSIKTWISNEIKKRTQ